MGLSVIVALLVCAAGLGGFTEDLNTRGVPVDSVAVEDSLLSMYMQGSLSEGDSLLKHYGGAFFLFADSVAGGYPILGLRVHIPSAVLVLSSENVYTALSQLQDGVAEDQVALWILQHTMVYSR